MRWKEWCYANADERANGQSVRSVWWENDPATMGERKTGFNIQEAKVLQSDLLRAVDDKEEPEGEHAAPPGANGKGKGEMPTLWGAEESSPAPSRRRHKQQRQGEPGGSVLSMPCEHAHEAGGMGAATDADAETMCGVSQDVSTTKGEGEIVRERQLFVGMGTQVSRTAVGVSHRTQRLRALGNGQVPAVVRRAWELLKGQE